jgi:hypothetical protein
MLNSLFLTALPADRHGKVGGWNAGSAKEIEMFGFEVMLTAADGQIMWISFTLSSISDV